MTMADPISMIGSIVTGVMSGGATGLIGIALQQWGESRKRAQDIELTKLQHAQAIELHRIDGEQQLALAQLQAASADRIAELQALTRASETASDDYRSSLNADRATYMDTQAQRNSRLARWLMAIVDFLRGIIRPGATLYSLALLTMLLSWVQDMHAKSALPLTPSDAMTLAREVVGTATYLVTTCTVWWFGVRPAARR